MIKLGLRGSAVADPALRDVVDELLSLLVELVSASHEAGDLELVEALDSHRRALAAADDEAALASLTEAALYDAKRKGKNRVAMKTVPFIRELLGR
jgi:hypothetical protein